MQDSLVNTISVADVKPDFLFILLVFVAIYCQPRDVIIASFVIGFAHDIIKVPIGPETLSLTILGVGLKYLSDILNLKPMFFQSAIIFLFGVLAILLTNILSRLQGTVVYDNTYNIVFGTPFYSAIIGPFLFLPIAWWMRIKIQRNRRRR
jgi:rod shape-determining protein MreD